MRLAADTVDFLIDFGCALSGMGAMRHCAKHNAALQTDCPILQVVFFCTAQDFGERLTMAAMRHGLGLSPLHC
jgi:hypothetical protein